MSLNRAYEIKNGLSLGGHLNIFEGTDTPEIALSAAPVGSIYIRYEINSVSTYQKTNDVPLQYSSFIADIIDGGSADSSLANKQIQAIDGGTL